MSYRLCGFSYLAAMHTHMTKLKSVGFLRANKTYMDLSVRVFFAEEL